MRSTTLKWLEAFYAAEYSKLVKILVLLDATIEEAEDAVQKAMLDLAERSVAGKTPDRPAAYVRRAAINFFIKERQRERQRLPRELRGGHLVIEAQLDDQLTAGEDEQYVEHLLEGLTPTQRRVIELVMDGWSTREIAKKLGKRNGNIRQQRKKSRDRLKLRPEIARLALRPLQGLGTEPRKEEVQ
jgi:RNA polymerase sigma factor (sigma-70 family)